MTVEKHKSPKNSPLSPKTAAEMTQAIALHRKHKTKKVLVERAESPRAYREAIKITAPTTLIAARRAVSHITPPERALMQDFLNRYLPSSHWDLAGNAFFQDWIAERKEHTETNTDVFKGLLDHEWTPDRLTEYLKLSFTIKLRDYALLPDSTSITVCRGLESSHIEEISLKHLGTYWTVNVQLANLKAAPMPNNSGLVLTATIHKDDVNWESTLLAAIGAYEYEQAIDLLPGARVWVRSGEEVTAKDNAHTKFMGDVLHGKRQTIEALGQV